MRRLVAVLGIVMLIAVVPMSAGAEEFKNLGECVSQCVQSGLFENKECHVLCKDGSFSLDYQEAGEKCAEARHPMFPGVRRTG